MAIGDDEDTGNVMIEKAVEVARAGVSFQLISGLAEALAELDAARDEEWAWQQKLDEARARHCQASERLQIAKEKWTALSGPNRERDLRYRTGAATTGVAIGTTNGVTNGPTHLSGGVPFDP